MWVDTIQHSLLTLSGSHSHCVPVLLFSSPTMYLVQHVSVPLYTSPVASQSKGLGSGIVLISVRVRGRVLQGTGAQWDWYKIRDSCWPAVVHSYGVPAPHEWEVHNGIGTLQCHRDTIGQVHNGIGTLQCHRDTTGQVHNGTGTLGWP